MAPLRRLQSNGFIHAGLLECAGNRENVCRELGNRLLKAAQELPHVRVFDWEALVRLQSGPVSYLSGIA